MLTDIFAASTINQEYNDNKKFLMGCLRGSGFGTSRTAEDKVLRQVQRLVEHIDTLVKKNQLVYLPEIIPKATTNVIFEIIFNRVMEYDDPELQTTMATIRAFNLSFVDAIYLDSIPKIIQKLFYRKEAKAIKDTMERYKDIIREEIIQHKDSLDPTNPRDFLDAYLAEKGEDHSFDRLVNNTLIVIPDAVDMTAHGIVWVLFYLSHHQESQRRVAEEIRACCGDRPNVTWADRNSLPFTEAVIMEVLRMSAPVTISSVHSAREDTTFRGYIIPKSAIIRADLRLAHLDPQVYADPHVFNPERFLAADGSLEKDGLWIPFGMGMNILLLLCTFVVDHLLIEDTIGNNQDNRKSLISEQL